jgi:hypothetical protein
MQYPCTQEQLSNVSIAWCYLFSILSDCEHKSVNITSYAIGTNGILPKLALVSKMRAASN